MLPVLLSLFLTPAAAPVEARPALDLGSVIDRALGARTAASRSFGLRVPEGEGHLAVASCEVVRGLERIVHQREVVFDDGVRFLQTEEVEGTRRRLVFREFRADGART